MQRNKITFCIILATSAIRLAAISAERQPVGACGPAAYRVSRLRHAVITLFTPHVTALHNAISPPRVIQIGSEPDLHGGGTPSHPPPVSSTRKRIGNPMMSITTNAAMQPQFVPRLSLDAMSAFGLRR